MNIEEEDEEEDNLELNDQVIKEINDRFGNISIDEAKRIIIEVTEEFVSNLRVIY